MPTTGKELWTSDVGVPIVNAPVANGGRVFVSSQDNHFHALAEATAANCGTIRASPKPPAFWKAPAPRWPANM